jgi:hypothetical protein
MTTHESFSHGLVLSKLWLCEQLEQVLDNNSIKNPAVNILASWDSLLAFMLLTRRPKFYGVINAYDIDSTATENANKLCDHWIFEYPKVYNHTKDINTLDFSNTGTESIFINCSVDQMDNTSWYDIIPNNRLVCLQTTNLNVGHPLWEIKQSSDSIVEFTERYRVSTLLYSEQKKIEYSGLSYIRYMMIGIK